MAQLMPLPLTVSCFSKIQIGFTFLVPAHLVSPGKGPLKMCVCHIYKLPMRLGHVIYDFSTAVTLAKKDYMPFGMWTLGTVKGALWGINTWACHTCPQLIL